MSVKKFLNQQFQLPKFLLQHDVVSDFYQSSLQKNQSTAPLLIIRLIIFIGCLSTWITSMILTGRSIPLKYWPIYMTHWGLVLNTVAAGLALVVSFVASIKTPSDAKTGLPWYVQAYWVVFNIATPIAFFITVFYWSLLTQLDQDFAINATLDIFIHGVNSILMFALLISTRHPTFFLHFYIPVGFGIVYLIFSYVYFILDGTDPFGNHTIYPMIDWEKPWLTVGIVALSAVGIVILHGVIVLISAGRDVLGRRLKRRTTGYGVSETHY